MTWNEIPVSVSQGFVTVRWVRPEPPGQPRLRHQNHLPEAAPRAVPSLVQHPCQAGAFTLHYGDFPGRLFHRNQPFTSPNSLNPWPHPSLCGVFPVVGKPQGTPLSSPGEGGPGSGWRLWPSVEPVGAGAGGLGGLGQNSLGGPANLKGSQINVSCSGGGTARSWAQQLWGSALAALE